MPSQKNITTLAQLKTNLDQAKSVVLADYRGLPVNLQQQLRAQVKQAGGELTVIKNSLLNLAFKHQGFNLPQDFTQTLEGPTITLFCYQDEIAPLKTLAEFAKEHQIPQFKIGFLNQQPLTKDQLDQLAKLPTKVELLTQTVATIKSPLTSFVNVLSANLRNLVYALQAITKTKQA